MARKQSEWQDSDLMEAWFNPKPAEVEDSDRNFRQFLGMVIVLMLGGGLMLFYFNSLFGAIATTVAACLITFVTKVSPASTRVFYVALFSMAWVFVGRVLEYFGYGLWALVLYVVLAALIYKGGRK